jgi:rhodanese-related sulfurtransferase
MDEIPSVDVEQLRDMLKTPNPPYVLDVREKWENEFCKIAGSTLMPLGTLADDYVNLPKDRPIVVHCHHGGRSAKAVAFLHQQGYSNAFNLKGGIHNWSQRIDPSVKTYE